ncbi:MAG: ArsA family ATPase [Candidatus Binatia bacterium]
MRGLLSKKLLVVVGEGGVGKTSAAAATALRAAEMGKRVAVLTIDPAPRLGDVLGLSRLDGRPVRVVVSEDAASGASLVAMRLDTRRTFDRMVDDFSPSADLARSLKQNPVYKAVSGSLGGSEHYMAFQRLYELTSTAGYDLVIVDTPPAAHADDLLSAPARVSALLDSRAMALLSDPLRAIGRSGSKLARATGQVLLRLVEGLSGFELRSQVAEFISSFEQLLAGLGDRANHIESLLKSEDCGFVLVTRPRPGNTDAALNFYAELVSRGIVPSRVLVNRMTPTATAVDDRGDLFASAPPGTTAAVAAMEADIARLRASEETVVEELERLLDCGVTRVPTVAGDIATLDDLRRLAERLSL